MFLEYDRNVIDGKVGEEAGAYLDNYFGKSDEKEAKSIERLITDKRLKKINNAHKFYDNKIGIKMLCNIHKYLFEEMYPWAGTFREIDLRKEDTKFYSSSYINEALASIFATFEKYNHLKNLNKQNFVKGIAKFSDELNLIHPFREGNGRVQKVLLQIISHQAGYELDMARVNQDEFKKAHILSAGYEKENIKPNIKPLEDIFYNAITPLEKEENQ